MGLYSFEPFPFGELLGVLELIYDQFIAWRDVLTFVQMQTEHSMQPDTSGLNGSGKSNILDAICFVLGISNLTQVRVGNLSELVYKQGQAGVTKASVTIVFNNEDKQNSPVGQLGSLDYYSILYS